MRRGRTLVLVGVLGLVATSAILFLWTRTERTDLALPSEPPAVREPAVPTSRVADASPATAPARDRDPLHPLTTPDRKPASPQGWRGLVLDTANQPLGAVQVHLVESTANEPLALPWMLQQRLPLGPLTSTATAPDGTFAIGLPVVQDKVYELFFVADGHATVRLAGLRMLAEQWFDVGAVTMAEGLTVTGRVTMEGSSAPAPGAIVSVEATTAFVDATLRALPAGDRGLSATVDATGRYELRNTPRLGIVRLSAVAPGCARVVRANVDVRGNQPIEVDFALPPGLVIRGRVTDEQQAPIANARIEAWPAATSASPLVATSDREGRFHVQNLTAGPHRVRSAARGFEPHEQLEIAAGRVDLLVTLQRRGTVRLRVLTPTGAVVRTYHLSLRRFLPDRGDQLAFVTEVPEQRVLLEAATDFATLEGIPDGTFRYHVAADGFAKTLSASFTIGPDLRTQELDVVVTTGATLVGQVVDEAGRPLADAAVATQPDGAAADSPLGKLLANATPDRITARTAPTDEQGRFELPLLAFADYQLEIRHPAACTARERGIRLDTQGIRTLPPIRMIRGALVTGRATVGGRTAPQMKIVLTSPSNGADRGAEAIRFETVADADGFFQLPSRVPPGMYELRAAVVDPANPQGGHFRQLLQLQRSATPITVAPGQDRIERDLDLPNDN